MKKRTMVFPNWLLLTIALFILTIILLLFFIYTYSSEKTAKGFEDEIYVVSDSVEYEKLKQSLETALEKEIYTPEPEKVFTLRRVNPSEIENFRDKKNILLVAPLNSKSSASGLIKTVVDSSTENKLQQDSNLIVYKNNLWIKNQLVTVLSAPTEEQLKSKISQNAENLIASYQKSSDDRLRSYLYEPRLEQKNIQGRFLKNYGWIIYVRRDFRIIKESPAERFVELGRFINGKLEERIFINWLDDASAEYLNPDSIRNFRNRITKKIIQPNDDTSFVVVAENYFTVNEVNFNNRYALFTQGLWELKNKGMGGPFVNYMFFDETKNRIYMIDGSIYAPKYYKRNLIQQVDVTLQSFRTETELSKDRIEDLLDEAGED